MANKLLLRRREIMALYKPLPYDAEIEYLETDLNGDNKSEAYINTGLIGNQNTKIDLYAYVPQYSTSSYGHWFFGAYNSNTDRYFGYFYNQNNSSNKFHRGNGNSSITHTLVKGMIHITNYNNVATLVITNNSNIISITRSASNFSTTIPIYLFSTNVNNSGQATANNKPGTRIYSCTFWESTNKVRDYIPVRVGQIGYMYDKVSGQLFGNDGTGSFILGPDIQ